MIFLLVRRFSGEIFSATLAALIFLTSFEVYGVGTFNVLDSILAMFVTVSMTSFFFAHHADPSTKKKHGFLLLFGVFCGLAFLTKGFLGICNSGGGHCSVYDLGRSLQGTICHSLAADCRCGPGCYPLGGNDPLKGA